MKGFLPAKPNFAYPKKVEAYAEKQLAEGLRKGDDDKILHALICYGLAETGVDSDAFPQVVARIDSVSAELTTAAGRALSRLLLAEVYTAYYYDHMWVFAKRTAVEEETDFRLWSVDQLKAKITELCNEALKDPQALLAVPLSDYNQTVEAKTRTLSYYPTLYDFACSKAIDYLTSLCSVPKMLGSSVLENIPDTGSLPKFLPAEYRRAWEIAAQWAGTRRPDAEGAELNARVRQLLLVSEALVYKDGPLNEALLKLYRETPGDAAGLALCYVDFRSMDEQQTADYYRLLGEYPKSGDFRLTVKSQQEEISQKSTTLHYPAQVMKGVEFDIDVEVSNVNSMTVVIYKSKTRGSHKYSHRRFKESDLEKVAEIPVRIEGTVPFNGKATVKATLDQYGEYVILDSKIAVDDYHEVLRCSDLTLASVASADDFMFWAVNAMTGHPANAAKVVASTDAETKTAETDSEGLTTFRFKKSYVNAYPESGEDIYAPSSTIWRNSPTPGSPVAWIRTSRPVYHPGDTLDFVLIAYNRDLPSQAGALPGMSVDVTLYDANNKKAADMKVVTDDFGRASGSFELPESGLTGNYRITAGGWTEDDNLSGSVSVMVSDYKLPTYEVVMEKPEVDAQGDVTIKGRALSYSGFPVQNAEVELTFENGRNSWWWRNYGNTVTVAQETAVSDAEGRFSVSLKGLRPTLPYPDGVVTVNVTVTSESKETHEASTSFALSDGRSIQFTPGKFLQAGTDTKLPIMVADALGAPVAAQVTVELRGEGKEIVRRLDIAPGKTATADLSELPSGPYCITITSDNAEPLELDDVVVYNPADNGCPNGTPLWVMQESITLSPSERKAVIKYATTADDAKVLMILSSGNNVLESRWLSPKKGVNEQEVTLPEEVTDAKVYLYCTRDARSYSYNVTIKVENPDEVLKLTVSRMRDRAIPGTPETLSLKVGNGTGDGIPAAVVLDVYCKALDAIATQNWSISPYLSLPSIAFIGRTWSSLTQSWSSNTPNYTDQIPPQPDFQLYGRKFGETYVRYCRVEKMACVGDRGVVEDIAPLCSASVSNGADEDLLVDEEAATEDAGKEEIQYRPSEVALAYFAPDLTTADDGTLTVTFPMPDANTTWLTKALAFTKGLATDLNISEIMASKPLMVQPNLPRFLRTGDEAAIRVTVMNASDTECEAKVRFEVLDAVSGKGLALSDSTVVLPAGASTVVVFGLEDPIESNALDVRVSASDGVYSDGERSILPVLPSSQPVTDSDIFYLAVDEKDWCKEMNVRGEDAVTVVSFCENPTWEVVSALPGMMADTSQTSIGESARIFSAAVSRYVLSLNPDIESHLTEWLEATPAEMRSSLSRNPELRQMVLSATPWVGAEASDAERINRLWLMFDKENVADYMSTAITNLRRLQTATGGWRWCSGDEIPSIWMTFQVLNNFAELRNLGCFPEELADDCARAIEWIDWMVEEVRQDSPKYTDLHYAYIRSQFRDIPNKYPAVYKNTVKEAAKKWDTYPLAGKAVAALLLHAEGKDGAARDILQSLREYAKSSPQLGMWWPNLDESTWWALLRTGQTALILDAFLAIEPDSPEIDPIRQWLILSKTTTDWKTSVDAGACVASILRCGSNWLSKPGTTKVTVAGKPLALNDVDKLTGRVVIRLDAPEGDLCVTRENEGPAWGAVMTTSTQVMETVEAHGASGQLSIEKQMLVADAEGNWHLWQAGNGPAIRAGEKVKVRLVITAARDFDYLSITDARAAGLETVVQTPRHQWAEGIGFYFEPRDAATNIFVSRLPQGMYVLEYEAYANNAGSFASGIATAQSQYAPEYTAHSAGMRLVIE